MVKLTLNLNIQIPSVVNLSYGKNLKRKEKMEMMRYAFIIQVSFPTLMSRHKKASGHVVDQKREKMQDVQRINISSMNGLMRKQRNTSSTDL